MFNLDVDKKQAMDEHLRQLELERKEQQIKDWREKQTQRQRQHKIEIEVIAAHKKKGAKEEEESEKSP